MTRCVGLLVAAATLVIAQPAAQLNLMPWPAQVEIGQGSLAIGATIRIAISGYSEPRLQKAAQRLGEIAAPGSAATLIIQCEHASEPIQQLGEDESYHLEITPKQAALSASNPLGVLRGLETFRQLIVTSPGGLQVPIVDIRDHPRFPWRGLHLDVSRHWLPIEVVKRNLDGMAAVKLNVFHWHLSDDQGFRVESKRFAKLHVFGSDGLYYTQEQVREVVAYARDRGIRVEVTGKQWKSSARIREFMRKNHLRSTEDLQAYFNRKLQKVVAKHGKRMEGWDEILDPDLPKDIVIQSWRGRKSLAEAARHGFSSILSAGYYLDHIEPASTLYAVDPLDGDAASLADDEKARILGGEVAMWSEFVSAENVDSRIWPRSAAVAERLWSPQGVKDVPSMYRRLDEVSRMLDHLGLTHRSSYLPMLERLAAGDPVEPLKTLADVVQPATFGQRIRTHRYTQLTPLNRLVDAARPESDTAREFAALVDRMDRGQIRSWLTRWRDNDAQLKKLLERSELLREDIPVSEALSRLGAVGLQALDYLDRGERPPSAWLAQQRAVLETSKRPIAELRLAIAPSIEKLVSLTASQP